MSDTDVRLWLCINRVLRAMRPTRWSAAAWPQVKTEFQRRRSGVKPHSAIFVSSVL